MASDQNGNGTGSVQTLIATAAAAAAALSQANAAALSAAQSRLTEIDAERETLVATIATLGGDGDSNGKVHKTRKTKTKNSKARTGNRATNSISLREAVARSLSNKPQSPTEIQEAVLKAGYSTDSPNFAQMVAQHLSNLGGLRMGKSPVAVNEERGLWTAGSGMERYLADPSAAVSD